MLKDLPKDHVPSFKSELTRLHEVLILTQVDKDSSGIAFVCKKVAHKLTKRFVYGPNPNTTGLFERDERPLPTVVNELVEYCRGRKIFSPNITLPQFKIIMKMHKSCWRKTGRPISSEKGSVLQRLSKRTSVALNALRPSFQKKWLSIFRRNRMYIEPTLNGPPVALDGQNGLISRLRGINRWISKNYKQNSGGFMETFDLSECYSKLDQKEIVRIVSKMISIAFTGKKFLAVVPSDKTSR